MVLAIVVIGFLSGMTYGPVAALLVEMFPARVRYTSLSVPYHIGTGYFGGFLPFISQYIVARTGDPFSGLWYTIGGGGDGADRHPVLAAGDVGQEVGLSGSARARPRRWSIVPLRLTLDGDALVANWRWLAQRSGGAACGAAVKADGYGLGAREVVKRLQAAGCRDFFVATWAEAEALMPWPGDLELSVLHGVQARRHGGGAALAGAAGAEQPGAGGALARDRAALRRDGRYRHQPARPDARGGARRAARRARRSRR